MTVYVVIEDDRGSGPSVVLVTPDLEYAMNVASQSSHYFVEKSELVGEDSNG